MGRGKHKQKNTKGSAGFNKKNSAEFLAKNFENVFIDLSGLPPKNLLTYFPSMKKFSRKFLFGTDFPGVPGIRKNFDEIRQLIRDDAAIERIGFKNARDLFGFWEE